MGAKPRNALMWNRSSLQVSGASAQVAEAWPYCWDTPHVWSSHRSANDPAEGNPVAITRSRVFRGREGL